MKASEIKLSYKRKVSGLKVTTSMEAEEVFRGHWEPDTIDLHESFVVMFLSRANEVLGLLKVSQGGVSHVPVDIKSIYQGALLCNASHIIAAHNHPSGNLKASQADIQLTKQIEDAGRLFQIKLLDHLILTSSGYYSLADEGMI
jgi:DNA repair protein RadC